MTNEMERLEQYRSRIQTRPARPATSTPAARAARLLVHGMDNQQLPMAERVAELDGERRCMAFDLPLHGHTPPPRRGLHPARAGPPHRRRLRCARPGRYRRGRQRHQQRRHPGVRREPPERLRTLTLTNCEAHDNVPPEVLLPAVLLARLGLLAPIGHADGARHPALQAERLYGMGYQDVSILPVDIARVSLEAQAAPRRRPVSPSACSSRCTPVTCWRPSPRWPGSRSRPSSSGAPATVPSAPGGPTGCATPSPAPARWSRSTAAACSSPTNGPHELTAALRRHWEANP